MEARPYNIVADSAKGGYILIIKLDTTKKIGVGKLGMLSFPQGFYAYLGSALGGFKARVNRHLHYLNRSKKPRWHIDCLLAEANVVRVILYETEERLECLLSQALANELLPIPGFGSSDCHCQSHLYFAPDIPMLESSILKAISRTVRSTGHSKGLTRPQKVRKVDHFNY